MYIDFALFVKKAIQKLQDEGPRDAGVGASHIIGSFFRSEQKSAAFDLKHNTDTGGRIPLWKLELDSPNAVHGKEYSPTDEQDLLDVVGVEFVPQLTAIAKENLKKKRITNAAVLRMDTAEYCFPPGDLVIYLFNTFNNHVMHKVIANLGRHSKQLYVI